MTECIVCEEECKRVISGKVEQMNIKEDATLCYSTMYERVFIHD